MGLLTGRPVIVPWDFSEMSLAALQKAVELVSNPNLVHCVHVAQLPMTTDPVFVWGAITEQSMQQQALQGFQNQIGSDEKLKQVYFTTIFGDPGIMIADYAKENDAELVIISSHGRTGVSRLLLGSVAERVVRLSPCPVIVLRSVT